MGQREKDNRQEPTDHEMVAGPSSSKPVRKRRPETSESVLVDADDDAKGKAPMIDTNKKRKLLNSNASETFEAASAEEGDSGGSETDEEDSETEWGSSFESDGEGSDKSNDASDLESTTPSKLVEVRGKIYHAVPLSLFLTGSKGIKVTVATQSKDHHSHHHSLWILRDDGIFYLFPQIDENTIVKKKPSKQVLEREAQKAAESDKGDCGWADVKLKLHRHMVQRQHQKVSVPMLLQVAHAAPPGKKMKNSKPAPAFVESLQKKLLIDKSTAISKHTPLLKLIGEKLSASSEAARSVAEKERNDRRQLENEFRLESRPQEEDMEARAAADAYRRDHKSFCSLLFSAAKLVLKHVIETAPGHEAEHALRILRKVDADVLEEILPCRNEGKLLPAHVLGESLEILCAMSLIQQKDRPVILKDYNAPFTDPRFVRTRIHKVWVSSSCKDSPFRIKEEEKNELKEALENMAAQIQDALEDDHPMKGSGEIIAEASAFAEFLTNKHVVKDSGADVIVWLKEEVTADATLENAAVKSHFILIQCKACSDPTAHVPIDKYTKVAVEMATKGGRLGCLVPLMWYSNVISHADLSDGAKLCATVTEGRILPKLLPDIVKDDRSAPGLFRKVLSALQEDALEIVQPPAPCKELRDHQKKGLDHNAGLRAKGERRTVVEMGTGSGKTILACEDCLRTEDTNPAAAKKPSLLICPRIDLVQQNALEWLLWERSSRGVQSRQFYYVVCSANESVASTDVMVISLEALVPTLKRHNSGGTLNQCRFFTTAEGSGAFWIESRRYGLQSGLLSESNPLFGVIVRDEIHRMCGVNTQSFTMGLNIEGEWSVGYTATPAVELHRASAINTVLRARNRQWCSRNNETNDDFFDEENELDNDDDLPQQLDPKKVFFQHNSEDVSGQIPVGKADPGNAAAAKYGLDGLQLLSSSLMFKKLDSNHEISKIVTRLRRKGKDPADLYGRLEKKLNKPIAVFALEACPDAEKAKDGYWDACWRPERRDFWLLYKSTSQMNEEATVVLGVCGKRGRNGWCSIGDCVELCLRDGDARGAIVHDCSGADPGSNLVGPVGYTYGFYDCFSNEPKCLADPRVAFLNRNPLYICPEVGAPTEESVMKWVGASSISTAEEESVGFVVKDPRKFFFDVTFKDGTTQQASAHDFASMNELLDLFDESKTKSHPVTKAIVFCPVKQDCKALPESFS